MKTFSAKAHEQPANRKWFVINAKDQILGDVAVAAANVLRGKNKPTFTPHVDTGDYLVILNAKDVRLSGKKEEQKTYVSVSGYIGSKKVTTVRQVRQKHPGRMLGKGHQGHDPAQQPWPPAVLEAPCLCRSRRTRMKHSSRRRTPLSDSLNFPA